MAYGDFKDLPRRTASGEVLCNKAFNIAKHPKYDGYQHSHASLIYKIFDKKSFGANTSCTAIKNEIMPNQQFAGKLHKQ